LVLFKLLEGEKNQPHPMCKWTRPKY